MHVHRLGSVLLSLCQAISVVALARAGIGDTQIATWKDNRGGALSLTIDDALDDREDTLAILDDFGVKATFFLNTEDLLARPSLQQAMIQAAQTGHEIGSHTLTHPNLTLLSNADLDRELRESKEILENLINKPVQTLAYPFGADDARVRTVASQYYIAARDVYPDALHPATGQNMFMLGEAPGPFNWTDSQFIEERLDFATSAATTGGWAIEMYHNLGSPGTLNRELFHTEAALRGHLANLTAGDLSLWVAPVGEVSKYYLSRENALLSSLFDGEDTITIELTLDDSSGSFTTPLTLLTEVPESWESEQILIQQSGKLLPFTQSNDSSGLQLTFDALPGAGDVFISSSVVGDFDANGRVDGSDFLAWQRNHPAALDSNDLGAWEEGFGANESDSALSLVPEPATVALAFVLIVGFQANIRGQLRCRYNEGSTQSAIA